jgi:hypothetical protein
MPDSTVMIDQMVAYLGTLPALPGGAVYVEDAAAVAIEFLSIAAPMYGAELDLYVNSHATATALVSQLQPELIVLRAEVDGLRAAIAQVAGCLATSDVSAAVAVIAAAGVAADG